MENLNIKQLKKLAREQSIKGYYKMRKAELIKVLSPEVDLIDLGKDAGNIRQPTSNKPSNVIDQPIPEINIPILRPTNPSKVSQLKNLASKAAKPVKREIDKFADWIISHVPEPIKKTVNKRVDSLKETVNRIFKRYDNLTPKEHKTAIKGYFKTFRVDGVNGVDPKTFMERVKSRVIDLIKSN